MDMNRNYQKSKAYGHVRDDITTDMEKGGGFMNKIKTWLQSLSFRTGVIVLLCCIPFYILSFAQMVLPISAAAKGVLWTKLR